MSRGRGRHAKAKTAELPAEWVAALFQRYPMPEPAPPNGMCPVMVAIPCMAQVWTETVRALVALQLPPGSGIVLESAWTTLVAKRNQLCETFLANPQFGAMLFLDSDMVPPPDTVMRLLAHQVPAVGALYFWRVPPYGACTWPVGGNPPTHFQPGEPGQLQEVEWSGTGCLLLRRAALLKVPRPWFEWNGTGSQGEDVHFGRKLAGLGIPMYCDLGLVAGHMGAVRIDADFLARQQQAAAAAETFAMSPAEPGPGAA